MKKQLLAALAVLFFSGAVMAQETPEKKNKIAFEVNGRLGFARLKQSDLPSMNGNVNGSDFLLSFPIGNKWSIASGVGIYEFNANTTVAGESASLKNAYLRIPLQFNGDFSVFKSEKPENQKILFTLGVGLYANTLLKQEVETVAGNGEAKNLGWNFGLSSQVGAKFILSDALNIGIGIESQSDLTKMKKDGAEQRIEQFNGMYFKMGLTF